MQINYTEQSRTLRRRLEDPPPSLTLLTGPGGAGKAAVVREALRGLDAVRYWAAPLPDADQRALLVERLGEWRRAGDAAAAVELSTDADWLRILEHLTERSAERGRTLRLVLEEFPRLVEARARLPGELERFWAAVRARGLPIHLVLAGRDGPAFEELREEGGAFAGWIGREVSVRPLTYREVGNSFPLYPPADRLLAWCAFGGLPRHLRPVDPELSLATNVRQAILGPEAPLLREGMERLGLDVQSPARYASILASLAGGRREWGDVLRGAPDFSSGSQMAPYLSRLQQMGYVEGEASLDAPPGSRSRRYAVTNPFLAFWFRFVLPNLTDLLDGHDRRVWQDVVRPGLDAHAALLFPRACREYLSHYATEALPATARQVGGLWGAGYDMDPAGTLRTGEAFYSRAAWGGGPVGEEADDALAAGVRSTRYGFGREVRSRLHFSTDGFTPGLVRRAARADLVHLIGIEQLLGGGAG